MKRRAALVLMALLLTSCGNHRTYAGGCGPPPKDWITPRQGRGVLSLLNVIAVRDARLIEWNGVAVSETTLRSYLKQVSHMNPVPVTQIKFAPTADCETVRRLRALMSSSLDCSYGKCAEGGGKWRFVGDMVWSGRPPKPYEPDDPAPSNGTQ